MEIIKCILHLAEKGVKESFKILTIISFIALFISPSFIFLYLYDKSIFKESNLFVGIMMMIVISAILYILLLFLSSIILPLIHMINKRNNNNEISSSESQKMSYNTVVITLILMGVISLVQIVTYYSNSNVTNNSPIKAGIITLAVIGGILLVIWIGIVIYNIYIKSRIKKMKKEANN